MYIVLCILWPVTSIIVMMLYRFLAGNETFPIESADIFIGAPIAIIILIIIMQGKVRSGLSARHRQWHDKFMRGLHIFMGWSVFPIFMNAFSTIVKLLGLNGTADVLFNFRYHSLWISAIFIIICLYLLKRKPA